MTMKRKPFCRAVCRIQRSRTRMLGLILTPNGSLLHNALTRIGVQIRFGINAEREVKNLYIYFLQNRNDEGAQPPPYGRLISSEMRHTPHNVPKNSPECPHPCSSSALLHHFRHLPEGVSCCGRAFIMHRKSLFRSMEKAFLRCGKAFSV